MATSASTYRRLRRTKTCTRCRRRLARQGKTKCARCATALKVTDARGARLRKYGATDVDVARLLADQGDKCFCGRSVNASDALDHEWKTNDLRGVLCPAHNAVIGRTDDDLFAFERGVSAYAGKRRRVLIHRACVTLWRLKKKAA